jgi:hypothetical protein
VFPQFARPVDTTTAGGGRRTCVVAVVFADDFAAASAAVADERSRGVEDANCAAAGAEASAEDDTDSDQQRDETTRIVEAREGDVRRVADEAGCDHFVTHRSPRVRRLVSKERGACLISYPRMTA